MTIIVRYLLIQYMPLTTLNRNNFSLAWCSFWSKVRLWYIIHCDNDNNPINKTFNTKLNNRTTGYHLLVQPWCIIFSKTDYRVILLFNFQWAKTVSLHIIDVSSSLSIIQIDLPISLTNWNRFPPKHSIISSGLIFYIR